MLFGKLSSQLTGNKDGRGKVTRHNSNSPLERPPHESATSSFGSSVHSESSSGRPAERSRRSTKDASSPPPAGFSAISSSQSCALASPSTREPIARADSPDKAPSSGPSTQTTTLPASASPVGARNGSPGGPSGRGRGTSSHIRRDHDTLKVSDEADNPLIDDLLSELEATPSERGIGTTAPASTVIASSVRKRSISKITTASTARNRRSEVDAKPNNSSNTHNDGARGSAQVTDSNAPRGLSAMDLTRGSSFEGFDSQGFLGRRSSDAPASMSHRPLPGSKVAMDAIATASQHFVHVLRMNDLDCFFSAAENSKENAVKKSLETKSPQEVHNLVISLLDILEEVRVTRGRISSMRGSFSQLEGSEKRAMSASVFSTMSTASLARPPVHETTRVAMAYDGQGNKMINRYTVLADLGQGAYGKVKLGREGETGNQVAIKIIDKKHLKKKLGGPGTSSDSALKREIAIMKKVRHRNCVSLYEVIDDPGSNKLYLIMDYVPNGPVVRLKHQNLMPYLLRAAEGRRVVNDVLYNVRAVRFCVRNRVTDIETPLTDEEINSQPSCFCCRPLRQSICALYLRQLVSGLRYMHKRNVVHHDIKPDNILLGVDHHVFLTDFGVSEILQKSTRETETGKDVALGEDDSQDGDVVGGQNGRGGGARLGGGTLLFTSPELLDPDVDPNTLDPYATDVWALGVTLYCMLFGFAPFSGTMYSDVVNKIRSVPFFWSDSNLFSAPLMSQWQEVLGGMLKKDPAKRWTLVRLKEYLDNPAFHVALRTSDTEGSGGTDNDIGVSLTFAKNVSAPGSPHAPANAAERDIGSRPMSTGVLSPSCVAGVTFPSIMRVDSISTSHLHSFSSSLQPTSLSANVPTPSAAAAASALMAGQVVPPAALAASAAQAADRGAALGSVDQNKYMPWDMGVSEQDLRDACVTLTVDMVDAQPRTLSARSKAIVRAYVQRIRDSSRPQQRLFSATPRLKRVNSQHRTEMEAAFNSARDNNDEDDVLTDSEDDPLGVHRGGSGRWPRVRPFTHNDSSSDPGGSSRSSEVPLVPVAGTFHRVTDSKRASPRPSGETTRPNKRGSVVVESPHRSVSPAQTAPGTSQPTHNLSVNPNTNTRPMGRRKPVANAADALVCGSQSLDAMLSIVELQSEGASVASSATGSDREEMAMGLHAFTRTRLPSEGGGEYRDRKLFSLSHTTPDTSALDAATATTAAVDSRAGRTSANASGDHQARTSTTGRSGEVRPPSVAELRKAVSEAAAHRSSTSRSPPLTAAPSVATHTMAPPSSSTLITTSVTANASMASATANGASTSPSASGGPTAASGRKRKASTATGSSPRASILGNPRPSLRKPVAVQKLASASAPANLSPSHRASAVVSVDTKKAMLADNDTHVQRQLSSGKDRRAVPRETSSLGQPTPKTVDEQSALSNSGALNGSPVLTAWEKKLRR